MADALGLMKQVNTKKIKFNGGDIVVKELTFNQVKEFSELAKELESVESFENNRQSLGSIIRKGIVGLEDVTDEDLGESSIASLKTLAEAVLEFNGLKTVDDDGDKGND